jgi:hypothetical protein
MRLRSNPKEGAVVKRGNEAFSPSGKVMKSEDVVLPNKSEIQNFPRLSQESEKLGSRNYNKKNKSTLRHPLCEYTNLGL